MRGPSSSSRPSPTTTGYARAPSSTRTSSLVSARITRASTAARAIAASPALDQDAHAIDDRVDVETCRIDRMGRERVDGSPLRQEVTYPLETVALPVAVREQRPAGRVA